MNLEFVKGEPYFARINKVPVQYPYLDKDIECDVLIVGGGVTGALAGYYMSKKGINTAVIEKNIIGYGSTSITTALLQYELDNTLRKLEEVTTYDNVITSYKLGILALDEINKFIEKYGNDCDYKKRDTLLYTAKKGDEGEIREEYEIRKKNGFNVEYIDEENNPFSFDLKAGLYSKCGGAELDPYKFTHQLFKAAIENNLKVYENTEAVKVNYNEDGVEVITKYGYKIKSKIIIVATGYHTSLFTSRSFGTTSTTFNLVTNKLESFEGYYNKVLIRDNKDPYNYFRTTADGRIIGGGQDVNFLPDINNEINAEEKYSIILQNIKSMFKNVENITAEYKYCGAFTSTQDNLGFIGKDPENDKLWFSLGYGANGILFAVLGGLMLSELYTGVENKYLKLFRVNRFDN